MPRKWIFILFLLFPLSILKAQLLTWTPQFARDNDNITITVDATKGNQGLLNFSGTVYVHIGVITNLSANPGDWKYSKFAWGSTDAAAIATPAGTNKWSYSINNIRSFFGVPGTETIKKIAILFRSGGCSADCIVQRNADQSDMYVMVYENILAVRFNLPPMQPLYIPQPEPLNKMVGDNISINGVASATSTMTLFLNGSTIQTASGVTSISANPVLTTAGMQTLIVEANDGSTIRSDTIYFFVANAPAIVALPPGVRDGINYEAGNTSVVLVLYAPQKNRVSVIGQLANNNWNEQLAYQMNKTPDGNYWWLRISGLTPGTEYTFQYLVDGSLKIADPYAEKILDPWNDGSITAATYPGLMPYPSQTTGIVSVLQTAQPGYNWQVNNFTRPDKRTLIIYELLLRDFISAHDWKTLRDTLGYLKNLGVNAIEILPFNEFEGNLSWGYNPDFYFAPDKYYGPKNSLKEFIDSCHKKGIAVIMDIALNHATGLCPLAALYWNNVTNRPAASNPWFNITAKHPFNVFNDFNHQSPATNYFFSRVVEHWLQEYKLDGFRFDLSKGFTQVNSCTTPNCDTGPEVNNWSLYDASRVSIWKKYYDTLQLKSAGSYVILEHFAANNEEQELSAYGMMLWGNASYNFQEAAMGWVSNSNFEYGIFKVRNWTQPHLITYMESHDEERIMYKNLQFGNASGNYNIKDLYTGLRRSELCAAFLTMIPGPKMIWQFGEQGYDFSINHCANGSVNSSCRTDPKPIRWEYLQNISRKRLVDVNSALLKLRSHPLYNAGFISDRITHSLAAAFKWIQVTTDTSNLCLAGNFEVMPVTGQVTFQNAGTWYDYLNGTTITATGSPQSITLQPGEFHLWLNRNITNVVTTPVTDILNPGKIFRVTVYPNPMQDAGIIEIENKETGIASLELLNTSGQKLKEKQLGVLSRGLHKISFTEIENTCLPSGVYFIRVRIKNETRTEKIILY